METILYADGCTDREKAYFSIMLEVDGSQRTITINGKSHKIYHEQVGNKTANEAGLMAALTALCYIKQFNERMAKAGKEEEFDWVIRTDSQIVAGLSKGKPKKSKSPHLAPYYTTIVGMLPKLNAKFEKVTGAEMKAKIGH